MKHIVVGKHKWKRKTRLSLVGTRLPHKAKFWGEKFNLDKWYQSMVGSKIMQPKVMEVIRERLVRLEILIRPEEEVEERSIIDWLKEAMKSVVRDESLYISLVAELSERLEAAEETIIILKWAVTNISSGVSTSKSKVSELKSFDRATSYNELENFLWDMEQYFSVTKISVVKQVNLTVMYLRGDVKLWWRTGIKKDLSVRCPKIETWDHLKQELKE